MTEFVHSGPEKKKYVQSMFDEISPHYDFLNHLLSFGLDFRWRRKLVEALPETLDFPVLDVATGTGDVGVLIQKKRPASTVIGLDYSFRMVRLCNLKARQKMCPRFRSVQGDGEALPFADHSFSALTISFGFRNIGDYGVALREFRRVLIPGGTLLILEFAEPESKYFSILYQWYFRSVLPKIGAIFARADAYRYLPESVGNFPNRALLRQHLETAGFSAVRIRNLTFGTVTLIHAQSPTPEAT